jgi:hypothetical protein
VCTGVRSKTLTSALVLLLAAALLPAARAASLPTLATQNPPHEMQVRPHTVYYTGDGTGYASGIHWRSWTQQSAFGKGYAFTNDCRPNCAEGNFHKSRATLRASRPRHGHFTRLTIVFRYGGHLVHDRRKLERAGGYWYWGV